MLIADSSDNLIIYFKLAHLPSFISNQVSNLVSPLLMAFLYVSVSIYVCAMPFDAPVTTIFLRVDFILLSDLPVVATRARTRVTRTISHDYHYFRLLPLCHGASFNLASSLAQGNTLQAHVILNSVIYGKIGKYCPWDFGFRISTKISSRCVQDFTLVADPRLFVTKKFSVFGYKAT